MKMTYQDWLTGSEEVTHTSVVIAAGQVLPKRTPIGQVSATAEFKQSLPAANDGSEQAAYITSFDIDTTDGAKRFTVIKGGTFNPELVHWDDTHTAVDKARYFVGTPISLQLPRDA